MAPFGAEKDKTEDPTPHRLREARRKGQVFRSVELVSSVNLIAVLAVLISLGPQILGEAETVFTGIYGYLGACQKKELAAGQILLQGASGYLKLTAPLFAAALIAGVAVNLAQVGFNANSSRLAPQLDRINPAQGFKRIFSQRSLFELAKAIVKIIIVSAVTYFYVRDQLPEALLLLSQDASRSAGLIWRVMGGLGMRVGSLFVVLAILDYLFQRHEHWKSLRMSRREVKDELKHLEGDPLILSMLRGKQRALAQQRMMQEVPTADMVITNPTAIAIALRYDAESNPAPLVVAKGAGIVAQKIREIAEREGILLVENPGAARLLWKTTEIGEEIPVELYQAVAEMLALVYRIRDGKGGEQ